MPCAWQCLCHFWSTQVGIDGAPLADRREWSYCTAARSHPLPALQSQTTRCACFDRSPAERPSSTEHFCCRHQPLDHIVRDRFPQMFTRRKTVVLRGRKLLLSWMDLGKCPPWLESFSAEQHVRHAIGQSHPLPLAKMHTSLRAQSLSTCKVSQVPSNGMLSGRGSFLPMLFCFAQCTSSRLPKFRPRPISYLASTQCHRLSLGRVIPFPPCCSAPAGIAWTPLKVSVVCHESCRDSIESDWKAMRHLVHRQRIAHRRLSPSGSVAKAKPPKRHTTCSRTDANAGHFCLHQCAQLRCRPAD